MSADYEGLTLSSGVDGDASDAERHVLSMIRDHEPLTWMHRRALWLYVERTGASVQLKE